MVLPTGRLLARGSSFGQLPQGVQRLLNVPRQDDGIQSGELRGERLLLLRGEPPAASTRWYGVRAAS